MSSHTSLARGSTMGLIALVLMPVLVITAEMTWRSSQQEQQILNQLGFGGMTGWQFLVGDSGIQWKISEEGHYWLREVDLDARTAITAGVIEGSFVAQAVWFVDCAPGTNIATTVLDDSGQNFLLVCDESDSGSFLRATSFWQEYSLNDPPIWTADFDGFVVDQDFGDWDWEPAKRYITLSRAIAPSQ